MASRVALLFGAAAVLAACSDSGMGATGGVSSRDAAPDDAGGDVGVPVDAELSDAGEVEAGVDAALPVDAGPPDCHAGIRDVELVADGQLRPASIAVVDGIVMWTNWGEAGICYYPPCYRNEALSYASDSGVERVELFPPNTGERDTDYPQLIVAGEPWVVTRHWSWSWQGPSVSDWRTALVLSSPDVVPAGRVWAAGHGHVFAYVNDAVVRYSGASVEPVLEVEQYLKGIGVSESSAFIVTLDQLQGMLPFRYSLWEIEHDGTSPVRLGAWSAWELASQSVLSLDIVVTSAGVVVASEGGPDDPGLVVVGHGGGEATVITTEGRATCTCTATTCTGRRAPLEREAMCHSVLRFADCRCPSSLAVPAPRPSSTVSPTPQPSPSTVIPCTG